MNWWSKLLCRCRSRTWSASAWSMIIGMFWGQLLCLTVTIIVIVIVLSIIDIILHRHVLRTTLGHPPTTLLLTFLLHHSFPAIIAFPFQKLPELMAAVIPAMSSQVHHDLLIALVATNLGQAARSCLSSARGTSDDWGQGCLVSPRLNKGHWWFWWHWQWWRSWWRWWWRTSSSC